MNILIKDMEMPKNCYNCWLGHKCSKYEALLWNEINKERKADCPLVPIPPHGRLIDARYIRDAIIPKWMDKADDSYMYKCGMRDAYEVIRNAPTIIPADETDMDSFIHIFEEDNEEDKMDSFIQILKD